MIDDIFYKNIPKLDLHGYDMQSAKVATNDFINENIFLHQNKIIIIHGIGEGLVRRSVHNVLLHHKKVKSFKIDNYNIGMTIIELNIE